MSESGKSKMRYDQSVSDFENDNVLDFSSKSKIELYKEAIEEKRFITGDVRDDKQISMKADWAHLEFMAAAHKKEILYYMSKDHWQGLKAFWACLWTYLEKVLKDYRVMSESYHSLLADSDWMIKNHAELKIKTDLFDEYVAKHMGPKEKKRWFKYFREETDKLEKKLEAIRTEEGKKIEEERVKTASKRS